MSIIYRLFFTALIVSVSSLVVAQTKPERHYRVELIVLRHLAGGSDSTPQQELRDLTELLDLYAPLDPDTATQEPDTDNSAGPGGAAMADGLEPEKPSTVRVDDMSDTMREAWRRLRGSSGFRPELFRAWEQSGDPPFPRLRVHDDEVLFAIEPDAVLDGLPVDGHGARVFSDETLQLEQDGTIAGPASSDDKVGSAEEGAATQIYYRIDGGVRLTRARFLNLDLDIELREPLYGELPAGDGSATSGSPLASEPGMELQAKAGIDTRATPTGGPGQKTGPAAEATAFRIHHIQQRRQVKAEQMEYFDGPVIGILALVTGFDLVPEESAEGSPQTIE